MLQTYYLSKLKNIKIYDKFVERHIALLSGPRGGGCRAGRQAGGVEIESQFQRGSMRLRLSRKTAQMRLSLSLRMTAIRMSLNRSGPSRD